MEKLLDSISGFVDQKLKNPFINTFIIAWLAFNWRPIIFFIFSKQTAETKIWFITANYSSICTVLLYPVAWTIAVLLFIPLILLGVEYLTSFIIKLSRLIQKKLMINHITTQGDIAKEKNRTDDLVLAARNIGDVNQHINQLEENLKIVNEDLSSERTKNLELVRAHSAEIQQLNLVIKNQQEKITAINGLERQQDVTIFGLNSQIQTLKGAASRLQSQHTQHLVKEAELVEKHKKEIKIIKDEHDRHTLTLTKKIQELDASLQAEKNKNK